MSHLFTPFTLAGITFRNRIFVSPLCQYSIRDGLPGKWHLVHMGSRAVGGAGLVMVAARAVSSEGRISPDDSGSRRDAGIATGAVGFITEPIQAGQIVATVLSGAGVTARPELAAIWARLLGVEIP